MTDDEKTDRTRANAEADTRLGSAQIAIETRLQQRLTAAIAVLRSAIQDTNAGSEVVKIDAVAFEDFLHDEFPTAEHWNNLIEEQSHG